MPLPSSESNNEGRIPPPPESAADLEDQMLAGLREQLGVCNALLELAHKEAEALRSAAPSNSSLETGTEK